MAGIKYEKRGNLYYVYKLDYYWDKELKKSRQKSTYLGTAKEKGGPYEKTGRKAKITKTEQAIVDFGDSFVIKETASQIGLDSVLHESFGDLADSVMNLACYQITEGSAMYSCEDWVDGNIASNLFKNAGTSSQDISRLFQTLGNQELVQKFFKNYIAKFFPNTTGLLIDSTSLPSAINASINAFGHTSDGIQENVTCLMLVDKISKLPIYFRAVGGDIADTSTLETTIREIKQLGLKAGSAVLDAGYCSKGNLEYMCKEEVDFITRLPRSHNIFYNLVDDLDCKISSDTAVKYGDRIVFIKSKKVDVYGNKIYAHVILDENKQAKDIQHILKNKLDCEQTKAEREALDKKLKYAGFLILLSKSAIEAKDILPNYYTRQAIEQIFGFAKSNNNILPLRVHSEKSINGYLLLVFISLILFVTMRQKLQPKITMDKALIQLRALKAKIYDDQILIMEPNKKVKNIAKTLNIILPIKMGV